MTTILSQISKASELPVPKGFTECPTDAQRAPVKQINGALEWVRTDSFTGEVGPPGPPITTISVAYLTNPIELNGLNNSTGEQIVVIKNNPNQPDGVSFYQWDASADASTENIPYSVQGLGGMWIMIGGFIDNWIANATASTSIVKGGEISVNAIDNTKVDITEVMCLFFDNYNLPEDNKIYIRTFPAQVGVDVLNLASADATVFAYDRDGVLYKTNAGLTASQRRELCRIGYAWHPDNLGVSIVSKAGSLPQNNYAVGSSLYDLYAVIGPQNISGNVFSPNGTDLSIDKSSGTTFSLGGNWSNERINPNYRTDVGLAQAPFSYLYKTGLNTWTNVRNETLIDPNQYNGGNMLTAVTAGSYTIQRIFWGSVIEEVSIIYGDKEFPDFDTAISNVNTSFSVPDNFSALGLVYRCALVIKQGTTDLSAAVVAGETSFTNINPRFTGSSIGSSSIATLQSAYASSVSGEIVASTAKGALKVQAELNTVGNLFEGKDETGAVRFSVSRTGLIQGVNADNTNQGLMAPADKIKLDGMQAGAQVNPPVGWIQYHNGALVTTAGANYIIPLSVDNNSSLNALFAKPNDHEFETLFSGTVRIAYNISGTASGNNSQYTVRVRRNAVDVPGTICQDGGNAAGSEASSSMVIFTSCAIGDLFTLVLTNNAQTQSIEIGNALLNLEAKVVL